jgi:hypothetical protein
MKRKQLREVRLVVELEWDPDVDSGGWPEKGPDHSDVVEHAVGLMRTRSRRSHSSPTTIRAVSNHDCVGGAGALGRMGRDLID